MIIARVRTIVKRDVSSFYIKFDAMAAVCNNENDRLLRKDITLGTRVFGLS